MVKSVWILANAATVSNANDASIVSVITVKNADHVAGDVAVGATGDLHGKWLLAWINTARAQRHFQEDIHAFAGDAVHLVIDSGAGLGTHERIGHGVLTRTGTRDDPLNVIRGDVLIWPQVNQFTTAEAIHYLLAHRRIVSNEIKQTVHKALHAAGDV